MPLVADQLRQFDGAWNSFLRLAQSSPRIRGDVPGTVAQISEIDHRLQNELTVRPSSPAVVATLDRQFADVAAAANDLMLSLKSEVPNAPAGVLDAANDFYLQAENCSLWLLDHPNIEISDRNYRARWIPGGS